LLLAAGALAVLVKAAGATVDSLVALARTYDVPDAVVASTLVALGTSLPELGSHLVASLGIVSGTLDPVVASATVMGGNMGSSTVQQTLLVGLFLVGFGRVTLSQAFRRSTYYPMLGAFALVVAFYADRGVDVASVPYWELGPLVSDAYTTVVGPAEAPERFVIEFSCRGDTVSVSVDDCGTVRGVGETV
jgi:Ca2+/Na+ antiporter